MLDKQQTGKMYDERYQHYRSLGKTISEAEHWAGVDVRARGHTCIESMLGPFCTVCDRKIEYALYWDRCDKCHGTGIVRNDNPIVERMVPPE